MRAVAAVIAIALYATVPRAGRAQESAYRFEIVGAGDSTFTFAVPRHPWVHAGMHGIAVDPARHDALIARFRILQVREGRAIALITGQTTRVTSDHVALVERPRTPWYKHRDFWLGTVLGAVAGVIIGR